MTLLFILFLCFIQGPLLNDTIERHSVEIIHPGIDPNKPILVQLYEHIDSVTDLPVHYYMNVATVVCGDSRCRIDTIKIYWDPIGQYSHIELQEDVYLEKDGGEHFTTEDYDKLDIILADELSPLSDLYQYELTDRVSGDGVDAMSGATVLIHTDAHIKGAVWTCYSLWHWTHSEAKAFIRSNTARYLSDEQLHSLLSSEDYAKQRFAIEQFNFRDSEDENIICSIVQATINEPQLLSISLEFLSAGSNKSFSSNVIELLSQLSTDHESKILNTIKKYSAPLSEAFYIDLLELIIQKGTYGSYQLFIDIITDKSLWSPSLINAITPQLNNEQFITARLTYWTLEPLLLSQEVQDMLEAFAKENQNRL